MWTLLNSLAKTVYDLEKEFTTFLHCLSRAQTTSEEFNESTLFLRHASLNFTHMLLDV
jgi:hypothetical protein